MSGWARREAFIAAAITGLFAAFIVVVVRGHHGADPGPPPEVPAGSIAVLLAAPAAVGVIGAMRRLPGLVLGAGVLCLGQAFVGFGSTLQFLLPAAVFFAAGRGAAGGGGEADGGTGPARARAGAAVAVGVVALVVGAWAAWFGSLEERCWVGYPTADGVVYERVAVNDATSSPDARAVASGCDSGVPTIRGATLAAVLLGGALAAAAMLPPRGTTGAASTARPRSV